MKRAAVIFGVSTIAYAASATQAQLIAYEGFDLTNNETGNIIGTAGSGGGSAAWAASTWTGNNGAFFRSNPGLSYGQLAVTGGKGTARIQTPEQQGNDEVFRSFGVQPASGVYWISAIIDIVKNDVSSSFGYSLFSGGTERNFVGKPGGNFWGSIDTVDFFGDPFTRRFEATNLGDAGTIINFDSVFVTPKALVLSRYDMGLRKAWHWVNPDISNGAPTDDSSWTTAAGLDLFSAFSFDRVRLGQFDGQSESSVDEFRLGRTFLDVAPISLPPSLLPGDFNFDGEVLDSDIQLFVQALTGDFAGLVALFPDRTIEEFTFIGDFNDDGEVLDSDINGFVAALLGGGGRGAVVIPEPGTVGLLAAGVLALGGRRRGRAAN